MHIEVLQHDLFEQCLEIRSRLVSVDVRVAVQSQDGADIGVFELQRALRASLQHREQSFVVLALVYQSASQQVAEHLKVVGHRRLNYVA